MKGCVEVEAGQHTDQGKVRERNEDSFAVPPPWVDGEKLQGKGMLYVVADGMGGHVAGLTASHMAVERIVQEFYGDPDPDAARSLDRAIRVANDAIYQKAEEDPAFSGMGSTLVAAVLRGDELLVANVGDSRAYRVRAKSIRQISRDHTWVQEQVDAGSITIEEARTHPRRNVITRSLGSRPDVRIDLFSEKIQAGDIILLCSDGIFGQVSDGEISEILARNRPQKAARKLVSLANNRGGPDNSTAVVVDVRRTASSVGTVAPRPRVSSLAPTVGGILAIMGVVMVMAYLAGPHRGLNVASPAAGTELALSTASVISPTQSVTQTHGTPLPTDVTCYHPEDWVRYVIQDGDDVSTLATKYGLPEQYIVEYNCLKNPDRIIAGEILYLPSSPGAFVPTLGASPTASSVPADDPSPTSTWTPSPTVTTEAAATSVVTDTATATSTATPAPALEGQIAFTCGPNICSMVAGTGKQTNLTRSPADDTRPSWSPDGSQIAFASARHGDCEIHVMNWAGTGQRNITNTPGWDERSPAWSPDGQRIAFSSRRDGDWEIYIMNADGSGQVNRTRSPGRDDFPAWSPDGRSIAFSSWREGDADIYVVDLDDGKPVRLTSDAGDDLYPAWSPDGGRIAFASWRDKDYEIYVMEYTGANPLNLSHHESASDLHPAWSTDGQYIAFASDRDGNYEIYVMPADGGEAIRLTSSPESGQFPAWRP